VHEAVQDRFGDDGVAEDLAQSWTFVSANRRTLRGEVRRRTKVGDTSAKSVGRGRSVAVAFAKIASAKWTRLFCIGYGEVPPQHRCLRAAIEASQRAEQTWRVERSRTIEVTAQASPRLHAVSSGYRAGSGNIHENGNLWMPR
jgi:hypothetical protein